MPNIYNLVVPAIFRYQDEYLQIVALYIKLCVSCKLQFLLNSQKSHYVPWHIILKCCSKTVKIGVNIWQRSTGSALGVRCQTFTIWWFYTFSGTKPNIYKSASMYGIFQMPSRDPKIIIGYTNDAKSLRGCVAGRQPTNVPVRLSLPPTPSNMSNIRYF